ncbi:hypothetical protein ACFK5S_001825 [Salmonella enterica subsp. enterica serovar Saintpaul]|nr:hypothetical protein [Salmonella enterica]EBH5162909.1 hypothetical protein [Salmonella enterica]EBJ4699983.1 hypothetical protein [Salmonella enterica]EHF7549339.1 hypothetical protein [Salmonella enterica]EHF7634916.1 hypothetical protein [Salmonella enterica]
MALNLFDSLNAARRLTELSGAVLERSKRYPQRYALRTTKPERQMPGEIEITVRTAGLRRCVHAARISGCTVYWEDGA